MPRREGREVTVERTTVRRDDAAIDGMLERARRDSGGGDRRGTETRYIYGGEPRTAVNGFAVRAQGRTKRRKFSTFNVIILLFSAGVAIVLYVNNILAVNQLAYEVDQLQDRLSAIQSMNASLRAEVDRKSSWDRIGSVATSELGLRYPSDQPQWFEVDREKLDRLKGR